MIASFQKIVELSFATTYLFNQIGKDKARNGLGKTMLLASIMCILNSVLLMRYSEFNETIVIYERILNVESVAEAVSQIGEMLLISAAFYTNHCIIAKIYGLIRIPTLVYLDTAKHAFDAEFVAFLTNLIYGIELVVAGLFILLNPVWSNKKVKNGMSLMALYMVYGFMNYLVTLFKLPFTIEADNMRAINVVAGVINTVLYLLMGNSLCHSTHKQICTIKNPNKIAESEEAKMQALIEFNEKY